MWPWKKCKKFLMLSLVCFSSTTLLQLCCSILEHASHSFISAAYVGKYNLPLSLLRSQMIVSSPGGDMPARQLRPKVNLKIRWVGFVTNLIVLE
jgi:hypothetical protein